MEQKNTRKLEWQIPLLRKGDQVQTCFQAEDVPKGDTGTFLSAFCLW